MAETNLQALVDALSQQSAGDRQQNFFRALGQLGAGLSAAGAPTLGQPNPNTIGQALGTFGAALDTGRDKSFKRNATLAQLRPLLRAEARQKRFEENFDNRIKALQTAGISPAIVELAKQTGTPEEFTSVMQTAITQGGALQRARIAAAASLSKGTLKPFRLKQDFGGFKKGETIVGTRTAGKDSLSVLGADGKSVEVPSGVLERAVEGDLLQPIADLLNKQLAKGEASQGAKAAQTIRGRAAAVTAMARLTKSAAEVLEKSGGSAQSLVAAGTRLIQGAKSQINTILNSRDNDISSSTKKAVNGNEKALDSFEFGNLANQNAAFKSNMLALAVLRARAEEKGRLSDQDIQRSLTQVGANAVSPEEAFGAMFAALQSSVGRIEDEIDVGLSPDVRKLVGDLSGGKFREMVKKRLGRFSDQVFGDGLKFGQPAAARAPGIPEGTIIRPLGR